MAILLLGLVFAIQQTPAITYSAAQLDCARFLETGESKILTEAGGRTRRQTSSRRGTWQFRATTSGQELALEGWLDSLSITRRSEETAITPDTDGLLGGRYRGTLSRTGHYTAQVHPFVPDEVAEVAGMADAAERYLSSPGWPLPRRRRDVDRRRGSDHTAPGRQPGSRGRDCTDSSSESRRRSRRQPRPRTRCRSRFSSEVKRPAGSCGILRPVCSAASVR